MRRRIGGGQAAAAFAREIGVGEQLLGQWVHAECAGTGGVAEVPLDLDERTELERLRREIQELCMDNEFLGTADSAGRRNTSIWRYAMVRRQRAAESFRSVFKNECYHRHMLATIDAARCGTHVDRRLVQGQETSLRDRLISPLEYERRQLALVA